MDQAKAHLRREARLSQTPRTVTLQLLQDDCRDFLTEPAETLFERSPLRKSLHTAITKIVRTMRDSSKSRERSGNRNSPVPQTQSTPKSRNSTKPRTRSPQREQSSIQQDRQILSNMHPEALDFLKKYFSGCNSRCVAIELFLERLLNDFQNLWDQEQALSKRFDYSAILPEIVVKLRSKLGYEYVDLAALDEATREGGLMGMLLRVLQELDSAEPFTEPAQEQPIMLPSEKPQLQNLLNIIQQFTEGLYKETEKQLYSKLNSLMRKLVVKYRDVETLLGRLNDKITLNADILQQDKTLCKTRKQYEETIGELKRKIASMEATATKELLIKQNLKSENERMEMENARLADTIERFQNHLMKASVPELHAAPQERRQNKSPIHLKPWPKDSLPDCYSMQQPSSQAAFKSELAATRFRSNTYAFSTSSQPPCGSGQFRTQQQESDSQQQKTPHRMRKNFDAYELKKGISSILTEKEHIRDEGKQASTPSRCSYQYNAPVRFCQHFCRKT